MDIEREYTLMIQKQKSILNEMLSISTDDNGVSVYLRLVDSSYFSKSKNRYLYSKIAICDKYKIIKENDITPIVDDRILFKISNDLTELLTVGQYQIYIRLIDERGNYLTLPPITMECVKTPLTNLEITDGMIEETNIDNTAIAEVGEDIPSYLNDGSYNRTIWKTKDLISSARMNKIENVLNDEVDNTIEIKEALDVLNQEKGYNLKTGTASTPVRIYNLPVGNYIINGYVKDLPDSNVVEVENARYYVTYKDEDCSYIIQNLNSDKIPILYKYDMYHNSVLAVTGKVVELKTASDSLQLTNDRYQFLKIGDLVKLKLPENVDFTQIHLFLLPDSDLTVTFPKISWETYPVLNQDMFTEIILTCYNNVWYGKCHTYEKSSISTYNEEVLTNTYSANVDLTYKDYSDMIKNTLGEEYVLDE